MEEKNDRTSVSACRLFTCIRQQLHFSRFLYAKTSKHANIFILNLAELPKQLRPVERTSPVCPFGP